MIELCEGCTKCKLNTANRAWDSNPQALGRAKFIFIAEQPTPGLENKLKKLLRMCSFPTDDIAVMYATRCYVEGIKAQTTEVKHCHPLLLELVEHVAKDSILIPMGANVCKSLLGRKVSSVHGSVLEFDGRICVPTYHPLQVYAYPDALPNFAKDLEKILDASHGIVAGKLKVKYFLLNTLAKVKRVIDVFAEMERFTFDIETTGLDPFAVDPPAKVVTINLTYEAQTGFVIPIDHHEAPWTPEERDTVVEWLRELLENPGPRKGAHNGKFDWKYLRQVLDITVANYCFDTMYAHYVAVTEEPGTHGLKSLAWEFTDMGGYDDPLEEYKAEHPEAETNYDLIPLELLAKYGAGDSDCTIRLWDSFEPIIVADEGLSNVFNNILMPAAIALAKIELRGVYIDPDHLAYCQTEFPRLMGEIKEQLRDFPEILEAEELLTKRAMKKKRRERIKELTARNERLIAAKERYGKDSARYKTQLTRLDNDVQKFKDEGVVCPPVRFSPKSAAHKLVLLFDIMKFPVIKYTDKKQPSTNKDVLKEYYADTQSPIIQLLGRYTKIATLYDMFVKSTPDRLHADGRIRGSFNPIGTITGRLSSSGPNLQQIPRNIKEDKFLADVKIPSIKKLFTVPKRKNWFLMQFDYSQAELRVLASLSGEKTFIDAFNRGEDIHKSTAAEVSGVSLEEVTDTQRGAAKAVNFGLLYGQGAEKLAKGIGVSLDEAKRFIKVYFQKLPAIQRYINRVKAHVRTEGQVISPFGRIRRLATAFSPEPDVVASAERQAVNSPIQSAASDCTLKAIIAITAWLERKGLRSHIIVTVHDSIILAVYRPEATLVYKRVKHIMETPPGPWSLVPMVADAEIGHDWGTLSKIESLDALEEYLANN
jgi:DNA polymerase I-like protein with 3'-5' exonuclease and polymerase domains/uracil-DNA glycosylase